MELPTRFEVATVLQELIAGSQTREFASAWACEWVLGDGNADDPVLWFALNLLVMADIVTTDRPYLYGNVDFQACLDSLSK